MLSSILVVSFVTFSITLLITKSKILAGKREFVEKRYQASKVNGQKPHFIHVWWHALWTCPMCSGFWVALCVAPFFTTSEVGFFAIVIISFGINWLLHCLEDLLFHAGKVFTKILENMD